MSNFKKFMAMLLVICMLTSAMPMTAWAAETDGTEASAATEVTEETQETGAPEETTGEEIPAPLADTDPVPGHMANKPADGTTKGEPFPQGTGGSNSFRIPALVTLSDGTLVAAADARWNTTYDGGGLDTIVARSTDGGANWSYTFANYLGDNGNEYNGNSSCFIDPALAVTANDTIYMLVDLYPYGIALNGSGNTSPSTDVGFNNAGKLLLSNDNHASYGYYLDGNTIKAANGTAQTGYYVDEYFNLYTVNGDTRTYASNLFFADSAFKVVRTGYLYLTKSTDKGATWSAPTLLNLKTDQEMVCLVGPGRGLVTKSGMILFPTYSFHGDNNAAGNTQRLSFVYSTDGVNWSRTAELNYNWASEAAVVELKDGTLRFFYRNGTTNLSYVDYNVTANTWGTPVVMTDIDTNSNCQISAITYSKTIDGKQVILVSCPTGSNSAGDNNSSASARLNGKIFAFTVEADGSMTKAGEVNVTSNNAQFMYSCLTELKDGTVGILYENKENAWGVGDNCYYTMSYGTYDPAAAMNLTFDAAQNGISAPQTIDVTLKVGETKEYAYTNGYSGTAADNIQPNTAVATMNVTDNRELITVSGTGAFAAGKTFLLLNQRAGALLTDAPLNYAAWGANMGLEVSGAANLDSTELWSISPVAGGYALMCNNKFLTIVPGNTTMETTAQALTFSYQDGGYWLIYANCLDGTTYKDFYLSDVGGDSWNGALSYTHTGTDAGDNWIIYEVPAPGSDSTVTFEGKTVGTTTAKVGNTTYNITVLADNVTKVENVTLRVGETATYNDTTGNYQNDGNNIAPNGDIATMEVVGTTVEGTTSQQLVPVTLPTSGSVECYISDGNGNYLTLSNGALTNVTDIENATKWTITYLDTPNWGNGASRYTVKSGYYYITNSGTALGTIWNSTNNGNHYFTAANGFYGSSDGSSAWVYDNGWKVGTAGSNSAKPYVLETVTTEATHSSTITFEGVAPGKTYAVVGNTQYNITVLANEWTVDIELEEGETFTYTDTTGVHTGDDDIKQRPDETHATMDVRSAPVPVTALESGKQYLIVNRNTGDVLTNTVIAVPSNEVTWGDKTGLETTGKLSNDSTELWTITKTDSGYTVVQDGKYLTVAGYYANMSDTATNLTLTPTAKGWTILDSETTTNVANVGTGSFYLSDNVGDGYSGGALGRNDTNNDYVYWDIYELSAATEVTFTGVASTTTPTTAKVGNTTYNITVVPQEVDDEVENTATNIWTVDPEVQDQRITDATVTEGVYTDETWEAYEEALQAAEEKRAEVVSSQYDSPEEAQAALDELTDLTDALEDAKDALVPGKPITIRYWRQGQKIREETRTVPTNSATYALEPTLNYNEETYTVSPAVLNITGTATEFDVQLLSDYDASSGIIGSENLTSGGLTTKVKGRPLNEMTVTVGITYDLDVADILAEGQTVTWSSDNETVATVNSDGVVTAVGEGTATITATIRDANGNTVKTYPMPITVMPAPENGVDIRTIAMYVDNIDNTTVTCVLHANGEEPRHFEVVEGELIYGQFQKTGTSSTSTGADSVTGLTFFGKPDEGYALDYMSSSQSAQEYFPLHKDGQVVQNAETLEPWPESEGKYYANKNTGAAKWLAIGLSGNTGDTVSAITSDVWKEIVDMAQSYADQGYDGAMGFTRRKSEGDNFTNMSFTSDPLPKIDKVVDGVLPIGGKFDTYQRYVENMVAAVDETVFFKITITLDRPLKWEPARDANGNVLKDAAGNVVPATDAYGKLSAITFIGANLVDNALEFDLDDEDLEAYFYTKELDQKDGATWDGQVAPEYQTNEEDITAELNKGWADDETQRTLTFYLAYKIVPEDIPKFNIPNTADLQYSYRSEYSSGSTNVNAPATASITVIGEAMDNVVIDFGQTIVYDGLTNRHLKGVYVNGENDDGVTTQCHATAKYGTVTVERTPVMENGVHKTDGNGYPEYTYTVTYTPTSILQGPDMVLLYGVGEEDKEKVINGFIVYPATTVYYEEGFAFPATYKPEEERHPLEETVGTWEGNIQRATAIQELEKLGTLGKDQMGNTVIVSDKKHPYGFDPVYSENKVDNSSAMATKIGSITRFAFTGDGIQIFANCTEENPTGYVAVEIRKAEPPYDFVKLAMVNTKVLAGTTAATAGQTGDMNSLPVVSLIKITGMPHGQYIVSIAKVIDNDKPIYIDGFRVFNTLQYEDNASPFTIDLEDNPEFFELRDVVLEAFDVNADFKSDDYSSNDYAALADQIYKKIDGATAVVTANGVPYDGDSTVQDLLDKGPKNELFLYPGQTVTFNVTTSRVMQIGLKVPQGATTAEVKVDGKTVDILKNDEENGEAVVDTISSSEDMFHYLIDEPAGTDTVYTVSIKNTGDQILSITLLKICDDPNAGFTPLTQEDIESAIESTLGPINIISQPADTAVKMGERFNVEVIAQGEGLKYQWYFRNAGDTVFHKSGVKDNTYDDVMTTARAGREVYCVITDAEGNSVTTDIARIDVIPETKLELLQQPTDQTVKMGERFNVEVIAQGEGLKYRWFFRNKGTEQFSASGVKDNTYDDVMTAARAGREVYCVITDAYGNKVTTNTVTLNVLPNATLEIVQQPVNGEAKLGERYNVEVIAQGDGLRYQWYYRNAGAASFVKSGVRDNTYDDVMTTARAGREVYCVITDAYGNSVTTDTVKLIAVPSETLEILQQPVDSEAKLGDKFLVEVLAKGEGLSYKWYYRNAGSTKFVVSGVKDNTYDDVMTTARAGREVYCVITDAFGNSVTTDTVTLIAVPSETLEIVQQPANGEAKLGEMYLVEVVAKGDGLRYQWYFRNAGETVFHQSGVRDNTYDDVMTKARAGREVYCVITDAFGNSVTTETVKLICIKDDAQMVVDN